MSITRVCCGRLAAVAVFLSIVVSGQAFADAVQAGVTIPSGARVPVMAENGTGYTPGTYAIGTIHLNYVYVGTAFPEGLFTTFNLNLNVYQPRSNGNTPVYPVQLTLMQIGGDQLSVVPTVSPLTVTGQGWMQSVPVNISIPAAIASDPDLDDDGDELVGHLQLSTPGNSHLNTVTDVIIKIRLVHPTACIKLYNFITDADLSETITATEVNVNARRNTVTSTNPYGSLSSNVLVANTCSNTETFDLLMLLDSWFTTQPSNNVGNAVFTFSTRGELDPASFSVSSFGVGTAQGQSLCLKNVSVAPGDTFLATVHMAINNGLSATGLPIDGLFDGFTATLYGAGSSCSEPPLSIANPNPVSTSLTFTTK